MTQGTRKRKWNYVKASGQGSHHEAGTGLSEVRARFHRHHISRKKEIVAQSGPTLCDPMDSPWNYPGQSPGVGRLSLLQGIFPTQGSNPGLPY